MEKDLQLNTIPNTIFGFVSVFIFLHFSLFHSLVVLEVPLEVPQHFHFRCSWTNIVAREWSAHISIFPDLKKFSGKRCSYIFEKGKHRESRRLQKALEVYSKRHNSYIYPLNTPYLR